MSKQVTRTNGKVRRILHWLGIGGAAALMGIALTGCQTSIGGQTLPSAYYLEDDVQYFPSGPEFLLSNQVRAIEQYKAERGE
ncbi:MAG TPA: hypothetical protein EYP14_19345, partial [Planctomycetaceae bacterium]|nr:hypothetical protein [Planctomycetaceae bacterium]